MRVITGTARGRRLREPEGMATRPTTDNVKESMFNLIQFDIEGRRVLDLFAGTGSISYEFASRGARSVTAVEINAVHYNFIRQTARELGCETIYPVKANAFLYLKSCTKQFDIIFADPPYDIEGSETIPELVWQKGLLKPGGWLIFEHSKNMDVSKLPGFKEKRCYGSVNFSVFERPEEP